MSTIKVKTIYPASDSDPLVFRTNNNDRVVVGTDGVIRIVSGTLTGGITVGGGLFNVPNGISVSGNSSFSGGVTFSSFYNTSGATFVTEIILSGATSSAVISCSTAPSQGQHLTNKTHVDSLNRVGSLVVWCHPGSFPDGWAFGQYGSGTSCFLEMLPPSGGNWRGFIIFRNSSNRIVNQGFVAAGGTTTRVYTGLCPYATDQGTTVFAYRYS